MASSSSSHSECRTFGTYLESVHVGEFSPNVIAGLGLVVLCLVVGGFSFPLPLFSCVLLNRTSVNENILNCCSSHAFGWMCVFRAVRNHDQVSCWLSKWRICEEETQREQSSFYS